MSSLSSFLPAEAGFRPPEPHFAGPRVILTRGLTGETGFPPCYYQSGWSFAVSLPCRVSCVRPLPLVRTLNRSPFAT